jgi:hypothetical protein
MELSKRRGNTLDQRALGVSTSTPVDWQRKRWQRVQRWQREREKRLFRENSHRNRINGELSKQNEKQRLDGAVNLQRQNSSSMKRSQTIWILYKLFRNHGQFLPCLFCSYWVCSFRLQWSLPPRPLPSRAIRWTDLLPPSALQGVLQIMYTFFAYNIYSEGLRIESRPVHRLTWGIRGFPSSLHAGLVPYNKPRPSTQRRITEENDIQYHCLVDLQFRNDDFIYTLITSFY